MALTRTSSTMGLLGVVQAIDAGTLARTASPTPGPAGLYINPPVVMQVKAAAPSQPGITIHPQSKISAQDWVTKINASDDVPNHYKKQIKSKGNVIYVTNPKKFSYPKDTLPVTWLDNWLSLFIANDWEMTTGCLDVSVKKGDAGGPYITVVHNPDLASGDTIAGYTKHTMTVSSRSIKSVAIERGNTLPAGITIATGRKLIAVATRIALNLGGKVKMLDFEDYELLEIWFHETACHAGPFSIDKPNTHGETSVETCASDIESIFPKPTTVSKMLVEITNFLK